MRETDALEWMTAFTEDNGGTVIHSAIASNSDIAGPSRLLLLWLRDQRFPEDRLSNTWH